MLHVLFSQSRPIYCNKTIYAYRKHCYTTGETEPTSCSDGGSRTCSVNADCVDHDGGFCCTCKDGYFGNGKNCLKIGSYFKYILNSI